MRVNNLTSMAREYLKDYTLYKGEDIIASGTIYEISKETGLAVSSLRAYATPSYIKKASRREASKKQPYILVVVEYCEDDDELCY